jgi:hypothetical protein
VGITILSAIPGNMTLFFLKIGTFARSPIDNRPGLHAKMVFPRSACQRPRKRNKIKESKNRLKTALNSQTKYLKII